MEVVPELNVEAEVDMEVLVMVVVEDTVRLPGLPPLFLKLMFTDCALLKCCTLKVIPEWSMIP